MNREIYRITLYAVQVYGVRLSDRHEPKPVEILCDSEEKRNEIRKRAKNGTFYDEFNCYYISEESARRAIDWALFILNIIYSDHEKQS